MRSSGLWSVLALTVSIPVAVWFLLDLSGTQQGFEMDIIPWVEPQSIEEIVEIHPIIAVGTINGKLGTITVTETVSDTWLTEVAPDGDAFGPEVTEHSEFAFEIMDLLKSDVSLEEGVTVTLLFGGPLAGTNGYPLDVGSTYVFFGDLYVPGEPDTIWPTGVSFGMIQADDLNGSVLYASDDAVGWASSLSVQEFIDDVIDEINE